MIEHLTKEVFEQKVANFSNSPDWKFEGEKPIILDFTAKWCSPCKVLMPILEEIKIKYGEKIDFYKVDIEDEIELTTMFRIKGVPTLVFFPVGKNCFFNSGAMPLGFLKKIIEEELF